MDAIDPGRGATVGSLPHDNGGAWLSPTWVVAPLTSSPSQWQGKATLTAGLNPLSGCAKGAIRHRGCNEWPTGKLEG